MTVEFHRSTNPEDVCMLSGLKLIQALFLCVSLFLFASCSGNNAPHIDTVGIMGKTEKAYFNTITPTSGKIVITNGKNQAAKILHIELGKVVSEESLAPELLWFSIDENILVIRESSGSPKRLGIFELNPDVTVSNITEGTKVFPLAKIDAYCTSAGTAEFAELHVTLIDKAYGFIGVSLDGRAAVLGDSTAIAKSIIPPLVTYQKGDLASLQINTSSPSSTDSAFLHSSFLYSTENSQEPAPYYCHLNNVMDLGYRLTLYTDQSGLQNLFTQRSPFILSGNGKLATKMPFTPAYDPNHYDPLTAHYREAFADVMFRIPEIKNSVPKPASYQDLTPFFTLVPVGNMALCTPDISSECVDFSKPMHPSEHFHYSTTESREVFFYNSVRVPPTLTTKKYTPEQLKKLYSSRTSSLRQTFNLLYLDKVIATKTILLEVSGALIQY